nr:GNAT family N-acetyltransferase [Nocardioides luti]
MSLPHLATDRLRLEPVGAAHLPHLVELNADPAVMRFIRGRAATPAETRAEWDERLTARSDLRRGLGYWAGFTRDDAGPERFAGWWSASSVRGRPELSGVGYRLPRAAWGRGLATEGARALLAQAFACPDVERVEATTMVVNTGSRAVLGKLGMSLVETWVQEWDDPVPGWEQGEVRYALDRAAFAAGAQS